MKDNFIRGIAGKADWLAIPVVVLVGLSYLNDPLALAPQLDAKENLHWAALIQQGNLPKEPLFRAMLYPWLISLIPAKALWPQLVVLIGLLLHIAAAFQVRHLAGKIWQSTGAQRLSFLVYALNPVCLFFALQGMDMPLAIVLFLGSLQLLIGINKQGLPWLIGAGLLAGLACLARPHFIPVSFLLLVIPWILNQHPMAKRSLSSVAILGGLSLMLGIQGGINVTRSGDFRILPWQGAYNLYAANRPGANGLYYTQVLDVSSEDYLNPARKESENLYMEATASTPPLSIGAMNTFWRDKTMEMIAEDPLRIIKLWTYKVYAVLNSYEQYNNLTYAFHKARIPYLRFNPLNWGVLLILATAGAFFLARENRKNAMLIAMLIAGYSVALILYYASARFRLPLVPLLAILSGGVIAHGRTAFNNWKEWVPVLVLMLAAGTLTFSSYGGIRNQDTFVQDHLLMANANADLERDAEAARHAHTVLWDHPERREAQRIYTVSYFNLRLLEDPSAELFGSWDAQKQWVIQSPPTDSIQDAILGVYFWNWGQPDRAATLWRATGGDGLALATACLAATGRGPDVPEERQPLKEAVANLLADPQPDTPAQ